MARFFLYKFFMVTGMLLGSHYNSASESYNAVQSLHEASIVLGLASSAASFHESVDAFKKNDIKKGLVELGCSAMQFTHTCWVIDQEAACSNMPDSLIACFNGQSDEQCILTSVLLIAVPVYNILRVKTGIF